ncbi:MAG: hypothetical protein U0Y08_11180, partial [Bacteroidia bacterium]
LLIVFIGISLLLHSCRSETSAPCTMEYRYITITVTGGLLDDFYTLRVSTGDTIRYAKNELPGDSVYIVLGDNYQQALKNSTDTFNFRGLINDSVVVDEAFVINADECHIEYISGDTDVSL